MATAAPEPVAEAVERIEAVQTPAEDLAGAVSGALRVGGRFLHLTDQGDGLLAVCDLAAGARAWRVPRAGGLALPRPSASGAVAALHAESVLEAAGVRWRTPAPEPAVEGRGVFTFPLGPVRGDVSESVGWRLPVMGDEVLGLRLRFGYKRRGIEAAIGSAGPEAGVALAERVTGTSPVAHALAYSRAWEAALGVEVPEGAVVWRGVLAESERLHSHLGDLAALAGATGLTVAAAELLLLREDVLQACGQLFGHRYLRGAVVPGGLAVAPPRGAFAGLLDRLRPVARRFQDVVRALDGSGSFLDRLHGAGCVPDGAAASLAPVGPVGRACGRGYDVRVDRPYGAYRRRGPARRVERQADAWARYRVRVGEVEAAVAWMEVVGSVPGGDLRRPLDVARRLRRDGDGAVYVSRVEAPRGELVYLVRPPGPGRDPWVRLRPPSAVNWALLPYALAENSVLQDVPIVDASFSLSVAAMDR